MGEPSTHGGQQPDIVEALTDDVIHRKQAWKPGERELVERQTEALEKIAKHVGRLADTSAEQLPAEGGGEPPPEGQPKQPK